MLFQVNTFFLKAGLCLLHQFPRKNEQNLQLHLQSSVFRSEEHTSELQSLMRISYAVFCLKKTTYNNSGRILAIDALALYYHTDILSTTQIANEVCIHS